jgi:hypothetical protein
MLLRSMCLLANSQLWSLPDLFDDLQLVANLELVPISEGYSTLGIFLRLGHDILVMPQRQYGA